MEKQIVMYPSCGVNSAIKRNKVGTHATLWINLKITMFNERSQPKQSTYCLISFIEKSRNADNSLVTGSRSVWWGGNGEE